MGDGGPKAAGKNLGGNTADTIIADRDRKVGTTDAAATDPNQPIPTSPAEKGTLKSAPSAIEALLRGFFGRPERKTYLQSQRSTNNSCHTSITNITRT